LDALSTALVIKALDGLYARSSATAENIANANSPGYRPVRVSFEDELRTAADKGLEAVVDLKPRLEPEVRPADDPGLRLDQELATASSTALRYSALIEVLGRQMQLNELAITGNG
jgi:flagellar basal-body rod protein FlgB